VTFLTLAVPVVRIQNALKGWCAYRKVAFPLICRTTPSANPSPILFAKTGLPFGTTAATGGRGFGRIARLTPVWRANASNHHVKMGSATATKPTWTVRETALRVRMAIPAWCILIARAVRARGAFVRRLLVMTNCLTGMRRTLIAGGVVLGAGLVSDALPGAIANPILAKMVFAWRVFAVTASRTAMKPTKIAGDLIAVHARGAKIVGLQRIA